MLNMKPYCPSTRIAVRDSIDEDLSDDIEDDVFIRDGKSNKAYEENGLKRPLMAPRRRGSGKLLLNSSKTRKTVAALFRQRNRCWKYCEPFCYAFAALMVLIALIFLAIFLLALFPVSFQKIKSMFHNSNFVSHTFGVKYGDMPAEDLFMGEVTPCTQISVSKIWSKAFSRLNTESPIRKTDLNGDGIDDVIFGYGVDDSIQYTMENRGAIPKCEFETAGYHEMVYCEGGILALDGRTGDSLWQKWTPSIIFSLICSSDLNKDGQIDCIASGRGGLVLAISGKTGEVLWRLKQSREAMAIPSIQAPASALIDLYTVNLIRDLDEDSVPDVLAARTEEHRTMQRNTPGISGHISLISGATGKIIRTIYTPNQEELYVPLQMHTGMDGTEMILILTGGQSSSGGIYLKALSTFMDHSKDNEFITIYRSPASGFMVPAILADLNQDGIADIVVSNFNSTVYAFDGHSYGILWKYTFADSESISSIVPGFYNNDNVTDFMVKYNCGAGFPIYYYSQTQIINGKNGTALLDQMINDSGGANSLLGGVSIAQSFGGDFFLHWQTQCRGKYDVKEPYQFFPDSDILQQSRADTCRLRYNVSTVLKFYAITRHIKPPGAIIFSTDDLLLQLNQTELKQLETQMAVSPLKHPKMLKKLVPNAESNSTTNTSSDAQITTTMIPIAVNSAENKPKIFENQINPNIFSNKKHRKKPAESAQKLDESSNSFGHINTFEKPIFSEQSNQMDVQLPIGNDANMEAETLNQRKKQLKNYILNNINKIENRNQYGAGGYLTEQQMEQQPPVDTDEYQNYYDEAMADRKLSYGINNRDVRSDVADFADSLDNDNTSSYQESLMTNMNNNNANESKKRRRPETLWDLELEKEKEEQIKRADKALSANSDEDSGRRRRQLPDFNIPNNQNLLAFISSTGVLVKTLDQTASTLDFVFILNVRESELYPPLLLAEDLKCVEDKINVYKSQFTSEYAKANMELIEKQFLKQCLLQRMPNLTPHTFQFDPQIVVTRISITCSCGDLKTSEKCSTFKPIEQQKWTEFMGNLNNGFYVSN